MKNERISPCPCRSWLPRLVVLLLIVALFKLALALPECVSSLLLGEFALLLFVGWILFVSYEPFKSNIVRIVSFAALFLWGAWISNEMSEIAYPGEFCRVLDAANNSLSVFFPSRGPYLDSGDVLPPWLLLQYQLFHFAVYLYVGVIAFSFFGRRLVNWARRHLMSCGSLNVYWGLSPQGLQLAGDTAGERNLFLLPREILADRELCRRETDRLDTAGFLCDFSDFGNVRDFFPAARRHMFLSGHSHWNVKMAQKLADHLGSSRKRGEKPSVYIRIDKETDITFLDGWANRAKDFLEVHIFSEPILTARDFVRRHPMLDCPGISIDPETAAVTGEFRVLLLGFGCQGEELLKNIICDAQFKGTAFRADVIDRDPMSYEPFACRCPEAVREYGLSFHAMDVAGPDFHDWIRPMLDSYNRILICLGRDELNLETAQMLARIFKDRGLTPGEGTMFALINSDDPYEYCAEDCLCTLFGRYSDIYRREALIDENTDAIAKFLNKQWDSQAPDVKTAWTRASFFNQESSRSSAAGQRNWLRLAGFDIGEAGGSGIPAEQVAAGIEKNIVTLAENEHLRWNAFHFVHGIHPWDLENPPLAQAEKKKANQIARYNRHAALVPFDRLPDVDYAILRAKDPEEAAQRTREDFVFVPAERDDSNRVPLESLQGHDFHFVRAIPETLKAVGLPVISSVR